MKSTARKDAPPKAALDPALELQWQADKAAETLAAVVQWALPEAIGLGSFASNADKPIKERLVCIRGSLNRLRYVHSLESEMRRLCIALAAANPNYSGASESIARTIAEFHEAGVRGLEISAASHDNLRQM